MNTWLFASTATPAHSPGCTVGGSFGQSFPSWYARGESGATSRPRRISRPADCTRMLASSGKLSQHTRMRHVAAALALAFGAASAPAAQPLPDDLTALAAKAHLASPIGAWCRGEFQAGRHGFAVAVGASPGGRYLVLNADATTVELSSFAGKPDLSCYTPADARKLDATMRKSETIAGRIAPRWPTTVVCAFTDNTTAVCW